MHSKYYYEDKVLKLKRGEVLVNKTDGTIAFRFRFGPVPLRRWRSVKAKAFGSLRRPRTFPSRRAAEAHSCDVRVRNSGNHALPDSWSDLVAHAEKNWKRQRRTQWWRAKALPGFPVEGERISDLPAVLSAKVCQWDQPIPLARGR